MKSALRTLGLAAALALAALSAAAQSPDGTFSSPFRFLPRDGEVLYRSICQGCHMPNGEGAAGAGRYPSLARDAKLETAGYPVALVVNGQRAMPPFGRLLDDEQVAAVVNYVRQHFGNDYRDAVTPADVKAVRP